MLPSEGHTNSERDGTPDTLLDISLLCCINFSDRALGHDRSWREKDKSDLCSGYNAEQRPFGDLCTGPVLAFLLMNLLNDGLYI